MMTTFNAAASGGCAAVRLSSMVGGVFSRAILYLVETQPDTASAAARSAAVHLAGRLGRRKIGAFMGTAGGWLVGQGGR